MLLLLLLRLADAESFLLEESEVTLLDELDLLLLEELLLGALLSEEPFWVSLPIGDGLLPSLPILSPTTSPKASARPCTRPPILASPSLAPLLIWTESSFEEGAGAVWEGVAAVGGA